MYHTWANTRKLLDWVAYGETLGLTREQSDILVHTMWVYNTIEL